MVSTENAIKFSLSPLFRGAMMQIDCALVVAGRHHQEHHQCQRQKCPARISLHSQRNLVGGGRVGEEEERDAEVELGRVIVG